MAMLRPASEMKPSGVQWLGNIPEDWKLGKVKNKFYSTKTIVGDKADDYERLALTLGGVIKRSKEANDGLQPEKFDGYQILKENELVFKLIDLANVSTSRVGLSPYTGIVSPAYIVLHDKKDGCPRYAEYYFLSMWMNEVFNHLGGDGVRSSLNATDLLNVPLPLISENEQQAIADYLDDRCSKIDEIITEATESIEEYKQLKQAVIFEAVTKGLDKNVPMKDSGVEWIGKIPITWNRTKVSRCFDIIGSGTTPKSDNDEYYSGNINWLQSGDINGAIVNETKKQITQKAFDDFSTLKIYKAPFIAMAMYGASIANTSIVSIDACTNQACCVLSSEKMYVDLKYVFCALLAAKNELLLHGRGGTQPNISQEIIKNLVIPIPPLDEQKKIADNVVSLMKHTDSLISEKQALIEDLQAYKKSLIYEVVTGKRKVV